MSDSGFSKKQTLYFPEFMQLCADAGYISDETAREISIFARNLGGIESIPDPSVEPDAKGGFFDLLSFTPSSEYTFSKYIVTPENSYAVELARTVAVIPRIWKSVSPVLFHAGTGQGKTHLLSAIATSSRQNSLFLNLNDLKMGYRYCVKTNKEGQLLHWLTTHKLLLMDDLQFVHGDIEFQQFLCSVFNKMPQESSAIVLCSNTEAENIQDFDATFFSRITSGISIELKAMNLEGRITVLKNLFSETGFGPGSEIIEYIATNITQNIRTLKAAGRAVLANLLASPTRTGISIDTVAALLRSMNLHDDDAGSAANAVTDDSYSDLPESPYIVVDVESEEPSTTPPTDEQIFEKAEASDKSNHSEENENSTDTGEETATTATEGDFLASEESLTEATDEETDAGSSDGMRERSIDMIEKATTVDGQIEALKLAAMERIRQLEEKDPENPEIGKLRFAIVFLNEGKIEAAMLALK